MSQTYRNDEPINIEAVYTFPLPLDAVLLDLHVEIGGRVLEGVVVHKKDAEEGYEDAVAAGDSAVMLEMIEDGLYTMNVGNLPAQGEGDDQVQLRDLVPLGGRTDCGSYLNH